MSIVAAALALATALAPAANAYKCKQSDGSIAFQQTPCAASAEQLGHQTYERQPDVPHEQYVPSRDGPEARKRAEAEANEQEELEKRWVAASNGQLSPVPKIPTTTKADGYSCSDGAKTWIQQAPCPSTVISNRSVPVMRTVGPRGEQVQGSAMVAQETPVRQRPISRDEICRQARAGSATQHKEQRASDASYERNKLRRENGC